MNTFYRLLSGVFLLGLAAISGHAQSQSQSTAPYIIFKTSYAFPAASQIIDQSSITIRNKTFTQGIYGSYGKGINLSLGVGKMLNPTFGVEMNAQVLLGNSITTEISSDQDSTNGFSYSDNYSSRVRGLILKPFIVLRNSGDLLSIYSKLGLAVATAFSRYEKEDIIESSNGIDFTQRSTESTETAKTKVGFAACFGLSFRVTESTSLFVEANGQIMALPFTKGHYTKYTENGKDQLASKSTSEKSWVYERSVTYDPNAKPDDSKPSVQLYNPAYFSYVGIGAGFIYHF